MDEDDQSPSVDLSFPADVAIQQSSGPAHRGRALARESACVGEVEIDDVSEGNEPGQGGGAGAGVRGQPMTVKSADRDLAEDLGGGVKARERQGKAMGQGGERGQAQGQPMGQGQGHGTGMGLGFILRGQLQWMKGKGRGSGGSAQQKGDEVSQGTERTAVALAAHASPAPAQAPSASVSTPPSVQATSSSSSTQSSSVLVQPSSALAQAASSSLQATSSQVPSSSASVQSSSLSVQAASSAAQSASLLVPATVVPLQLLSTNPSRPSRFGIRRIIRKALRRTSDSEDAPELDGGQLPKEGDLMEVVLSPLPTGIPRVSMSVSKGVEDKGRPVIGGLGRSSDRKQGPDKEGTEAQPGSPLETIGSNDQDQEGHISCLTDDILLECLVRVNRPSIGPAMAVCRAWRAIVRSTAFWEYRDALGLTDNFVFVFSVVNASRQAGNDLAGPLTEGRWSNTTAVGHIPTTMHPHSTHTPPRAHRHHPQPSLNSDTERARGDQSVNETSTVRSMIGVRSRNRTEEERVEVPVPADRANGGLGGGEQMGSALANLVPGTSMLGGAAPVPGNDAERSSGDGQGQHSGVGRGALIGFMDGLTFPPEGQQGDMAQEPEHEQIPRSRSAGSFSAACQQQQQEQEQQQQEQQQQHSLGQSLANFRANARLAASRAGNSMLEMVHHHNLQFQSTVQIVPAGLSSASPAPPSEYKLIIQVFHPKINKWLKRRELPAGSLRIDDYSHCCSLSSSVVIFPGILCKGKQQPPLQYSPWTHSLTPLPLLNVPRYKFVSGQVQSRLVVAGGMRECVVEGDEDKKDLRSVEMYDPETNAWHQLAEMQKLRYDPVGGAHDGKMYVIGGTRSQRQFSPEAAHKSLECLDAGAAIAEWEQAFNSRAGSPENEQGGGSGEGEHGNGDGVEHESRTAAFGAARCSKAAWRLREPIPQVGLILGAVVLGSSVFILRNEGLRRISWLRYNPKRNEWKSMHDVPGIPPEPSILSRIDFKLVAFRAKILIIQVRGTYGDINPQAAANAKRKPLVLLYNPKGESTSLYKRLADVPKVCQGAVCALVRC